MAIRRGDILVFPMRKVYESPTTGNIEYRPFMTGVAVEDVPDSQMTVDVYPYYLARAKEPIPRSGQSNDILHLNRNEVMLYQELYWQVDNMMAEEQ